MIKIDMHVHTRFSIDSYSRPDRIMKVAKKIGLDGVAITDHDSMKGIKESEEAAKKHGLFLIKGEEVHTDWGDIVGLFLTREIESRDVLGVIEEIHAQDGIVLLPHPYRSHDLSGDWISMVDVVEAGNGRVKSELNEKAMDLAKTLGKPISAGSDAHFVRELGAGATIFDSDDFKSCLLEGKTSISVKTSPAYLEALSMAVLTTKTKRFHMTPVFIASAAVKLIRRTRYE